jgi:hypothetical protein
MRCRRFIAVTAVTMAIGVSFTGAASAQVCDCQFGNSNQNGHIGGALGGGLFAGLVAAVLHMSHQQQAAVLPSTVPVSGPSPVEPPVVASASGEVAADPSADPAKKAVNPRPARAMAPRPMSPKEARQEGLVPPRTATIFPALGMIGAGCLLLGLFLIRERKRRAWW